MALFIGQFQVSLIRQPQLAFQMTLPSQQDLNSFLNFHLHLQLRLQLFQAKLLQVLLPLATLSSILTTQHFKQVCFILLSHFIQVQLSMHDSLAQLLAFPCSQVKLHPLQPQANFLLARLLVLLSVKFESMSPHSLEFIEFKSFANLQLIPFPIILLATFSPLHHDWADSANQHSFPKLWENFSLISAQPLLLCALQLHFRLGLDSPFRLLLNRGASWARTWYKRYYKIQKVKNEGCKQIKVFN